MSKTKNPVVVITGASSGNGRATALRFASWSALFGAGAVILPRTLAAMRAASDARSRARLIPRQRRA